MGTPEPPPIHLCTEEPGVRRNINGLLRDQFSWIDPKPDIEKAITQRLKK
jgi:hypothetical protein